METPHGVQLVTVEPDHSYKLNERELEKILLREDVKNLPVAVVSVVGAFRTGKSFLLNFFLRYLSASPSARTDGSWQGDANQELTGFSWRGGSQRNTTGILMWSEPYIITLPSEEKVAVLLMDTQGTFDSSSTVRDNSTIFALSSVISSTQVYNIKTNVTEEDLQNLQLFTDYGKLMKDQNGKAFQELLFLIRDWMNDWEYNYGLAGGNSYLAEKLKHLMVHYWTELPPKWENFAIICFGSRIDDRRKQKKTAAFHLSDPSQPQELRDIRQHILASFEKVSCFLMPHPGLAVARPNFKGKASEMTLEFVNVLKELSSSIFSPDKLCIKRLNGQPVTSQELFTYFKSYMSIFNSADAPTTTTIFQATSEAGFLLAAKQIREEFEKNMQAACGSDAPSMPGQEVINIHQRQLASSRGAFQAKKLLGEQDTIDKKLEEFMQELKDKENVYIEINRLKTFEAIERGNAAYDQAIESVTMGKPLCVHELDLQKIQDDAVAAALNAFSVNRKTGPDGQDADKDKFTNDLRAKYENLELTNGQNNKLMVNELKAEYIEHMMDIVNGVPNHCGSTLSDDHEQARKKAEDGFESRRNRPNTYGIDSYKTSMLQGIEVMYIQAKQLNASTNKGLLQSAMNIFNYNSPTVSSWRSNCLPPDVLRREHEAAKRTAINFINLKQLCGDNNDVLEQYMNNHYEDMKAINEAANEAAVTRAYWAYQSRYDELSSHWYWVFTSWGTARKYHQEALAVAENKFYQYRRDGRTYGYDPYLWNLQNRCEQYYNKG